MSHLTINLSTHRWALPEQVIRIRFWSWQDLRESMIQGWGLGLEWRQLHGRWFADFDVQRRRNGQ
jgi:hypothetical protein